MFTFSLIKNTHLVTNQRFSLSLAIHVFILKDILIVVGKGKSANLEGTNFSVLKSNVRFKYV